MAGDIKSFNESFEVPMGVPGKEGLKLRAAIILSGLLAQNGAGTIAIEDFYLNQAIALAKRLDRWINNA